MRLVDIEDILGIERDDFPEDPWTRQDFILAKRSPEVHCVVVWGLIRIVAYMVWMRGPARYEATILRLVVRKKSRRMGLGTGLVDGTAQYLDGMRAKFLRCRVPERSLAGQLLLRECGFHCVRTVKGVRRNRYMFERELAK
jgi:ribosomal protein S18 acetylase RimI-like enzyme